MEAESTVILWNTGEVWHVHAHSVNLKTKDSGLQWIDVYTIQSQYTVQWLSEYTIQSHSSDPVTLATDFWRPTQHLKV